MATSLKSHGTGAAGGRERRDGGWSTLRAAAASAGQRASGASGGPPRTAPLSVARLTNGELILRHLGRSTSGGRHIISMSTTGVITSGTFVDPGSGTSSGSGSSPGSRRRFNRSNRRSGTTRPFVLHAA